MPEQQTSSKNKSSSRRNFLKKSTAAVVGSAVASTLTVQKAAHAAGSDLLKVGLIGCGGRGSGAAVNAMRGDPNARLVAMADMFQDKLYDSRERLQRSLTQQGLAEQFAVTDENCFVGFDAYKKVMETDVDVVLLTTPPHFRPAHLKAAVEANKHVFCEKPVAVDAPGVRSVFETVEEAERRNLSIVSGLCWRYDTGVRETMKRIKNGDIGEIISVQENYLTGTLWHRGRNPDWSEMEYQLRNWLYFTWLSGDHINEQHVHSLDKGLWLMDDQPPLRCFGLGGRQVRTDEKFGNIYDHHAVCYEFPGDKKVFSYTRQMDKCFNDVDDYVYGTKGSAKVLDFTITGENPWRLPREIKRSKASMYDIEHKELFAGLRSGEHINNGIYMTRSTMMAIMGRMACYTGESLSWDEALNSQEDLTPFYEFGDLKMRDVALPGFTKFS